MCLLRLVCATHQCTHAAVPAEVVGPLKAEWPRWLSKTWNPRWQSAYKVKNFVKRQKFQGPRDGQLKSPSIGSPNARSGDKRHLTSGSLPTKPYTVKPPSRNTSLFVSKAEDLNKHPWNFRHATGNSIPQKVDSTTSSRYSSNKYRQVRDVKAVYP